MCVCVIAMLLQGSVLDRSLRCVIDVCISESLCLYVCVCMCVCVSLMTSMSSLKVKLFSVSDVNKKITSMIG